MAVSMPMGCRLCRPSGHRPPAGSEGPPVRVLFPCLLIQVTIEGHDYYLLFGEHMFTFSGARSRFSETQRLAPCLSGHVGSVPVQKGGESMGRLACSTRLGWGTGRLHLCGQAGSLSVVTGAGATVQITTRYHPRSWEQTGNWVWAIGERGKGEGPSTLSGF